MLLKKSKAAGAAYYYTHIQKATTQQKQGRENLVRITFHAKFDSQFASNLSVGALRSSPYADNDDDVARAPAG
jgi:hypothetical protein